MGLGPGKMDLMLFGWEKTAEAALPVEEVSKAMGGASAAPEYPEFSG